MQKPILHIPPESSQSGEQPVKASEEPTPPKCFTKKSLASYLERSVQSLTRDAARGYLPPPDFICGRSPRWTPETIAKWLKARPRLPGRGRD
jgi:hypothetical protein